VASRSGTPRPQNVPAVRGAAFKAWAEANGVIRNYTLISEETWKDIVSDFRRGLDLLKLLLSDAEVYDDLAARFEARMISATGRITSAIKSYAQGVTSAISILNSTIGNIQGGVGADTSALSVTSGLTITQSPQLTTARQGFASGSSSTVIDRSDRSDRSITINGLRIDGNDEDSRALREILERMFGRAGLGLVASMNG